LRDLHREVRLWNTITLNYAEEHICTPNNCLKLKRKRCTFDKKGFSEEELMHDLAKDILSRRTFLRFI
jgi:hypothetical protein